MLCDKRYVRQNLVAAYDEIFNEAQDTEDKELLSKLDTMIREIDKYIAEEEVNLCSNKVSIGDIIETICKHDGCYTYEKYKVIGIESNGEISQQTLLNLKYNTIALDEPLDIEEDITKCFDDTDEKIQNIYRNEDDSND